MKLSLPNKLLPFLWGVVAGIITGSLFCIVLTVIYYQNRHDDTQQPPSTYSSQTSSRNILDLTTPSLGGRVQWKGGAVLEKTKATNIPGNLHANVRFSPSVESGFSYLILEKGPRDWQQYDALNFTVSNPEANDIGITLTIKSEKEYKLKTYTRGFTIPAKRTIALSVAISEIAQKIDLDNIGLLSILANPPVSSTLSFGNFKLINQPEGMTKTTAVAVKKEEQEIAPHTLKLTLDPTRRLKAISPFIYGSNLPAKTEFEKDVAQFAKDSGITIFRFPGGGLEGYHWKSGTFEKTDRYQTAPLAKIDNVIEFAKLSGAKLLLEVNITPGTPEEAAQWVGYMNQQTDFRVDYWELGNEVYGNWDEAHMSAEEYAVLVNKFSAAMKAVDPTIKIGVDVGGMNYPDFDATVIKNTADAIDFLSFHWYPNHVNHDHPMNNSVHPSPEEVMANAHAIPQIVARFNRIIEKYAPHRQGKIELTFLEWDGSWDAPPSDLRYEAKAMIWSLANGIFHADALGQFALQGIPVACQYTFQEIMFGMIRGWDRNAGWGGDRWDGKTIRPKALAFQLFSRHFGDTLIEGNLEGSPTYDKAPDLWGDSYVGKVPYVTAYSSIFKNENKTAIVLVNKHPDQTFNVMLNFTNSTPTAEGKAWLLTGPSLTAQNDGSPGQTDIKEFNVTGISNEFYIQVPAKSVLLLQIPVN